MSYNITKHYTAFRNSLTERFLQVHSLSYTGNMFCNGRKCYFCCQRQLQVIFGRKFERVTFFTPVKNGRHFRVLQKIINILERLNLKHWYILMIPYTLTLILTDFFYLRIVSHVQCCRHHVTLLYAKERSLCHVITSSWRHKNMTSTNRLILERIHEKKNSDCIPWKIFNNRFNLLSMNKMLPVTCKIKHLTGNKIEHINNMYKYFTSCHRKLKMPYSKLQFDICIDSF